MELPSTSTTPPRADTAPRVGARTPARLAGPLLPPLDARCGSPLAWALSAAAEEISAELAPGSVDVRLRGGTAGFVVTPPPAARRSCPHDDAVAGPVEVGGGPLQGDDAAMVRINLRLPATLKSSDRGRPAPAGSSPPMPGCVRAPPPGANEGRRAHAAAPRKKPDRIVGERYSGWGR